MANHKNIPTGNRQLKAGEVIKRALVEIFAKGKFFDANIADVPITISEVRISPDLKVATIFVYPLGSKVDRLILMQGLKNSTPTLRAMVTKKVQLKYSTELVFKLDETFDNVQKIDHILKSL
jgi:ribosome-binding factor A